MTTPTSDYSESWIDPIFDAVLDDVLRSGFYDKVQQHEPKRKPGYGLTAALWVQQIDPLGGASGLAATSGRIVFMLRSYQGMLSEPQDAIDPELTRAVSNLMRRYHDDFDFGLDPLVRNVDLLGAFGIPLAARAGYLEQDNALFRVMDLTIPLIINDIWAQVP